MKRTLLVAAWWTITAPIWIPLAILTTIIDNIDQRGGKY